MEDNPIFLNMEDDLIIVRPSLNLLEIVCWLEYVEMSTYKQFAHRLGNFLFKLWRYCSSYLPAAVQMRIAVVFISQIVERKADFIWNQLKFEKLLVLYIFVFILKVDFAKYKQMWISGMNWSEQRGLPSSAQAPTKLSWGCVSLIFTWNSHPPTSAHP